MGTSKLLKYEINPIAIYVLWLREMKRFIRAKSRVIGTITMPLLFLVFLGLGFSKMPVLGEKYNISYVNFLVPGILGMSLLSTSMFAGISVLWDKEFGFLKEVMVTPVSRLSIVLGRTLGGVTIALIQALVILMISAVLGFRPVSALAVFPSLLFMFLISTTFIGVGLILASKMGDIQGFGLVVQFITFPTFFLSGALFPIENLPIWLRYVCYANPLTYGVDGLRAALVNVYSLDPLLDLLILFIFSTFMAFLGAYFFEKSEAV